MNDKHKPASCEECETPDGYKLVTRVPESVSRHGIAFEMRDLQWYECSHCGDVINTPDVMKSNAQLIDNAYASKRERVRVEKNLLDPSCIRQIRTRLNVTQENLSAMFGIGENGLQKYETGKTCPSKPVDLLLRLVGRHPALLDVIKQVSAIPTSEFSNFLSTTQKIATKHSQLLSVTHLTAPVNLYVFSNMEPDPAIFRSFKVQVDDNHAGTVDTANAGFPYFSGGLGTKASQANDHFFTRESAEIEDNSLERIHWWGGAHAARH